MSRYEEEHHLTEAKVAPFTPAVPVASRSPSKYLWAPQRIQSALQGAARKTLRHAVDFLICRLGERGRRGTKRLLGGPTGTSLAPRREC
ncbi:hypothetical protein E2C01_082598 [Portunus trituberculatus]|uniref:Uncharacterized protein n=1 Tax=Portunus trituberculatus TaxID=210409 RepID=A0A5B7J1A2_PORTR|nr:hypothetical protein [Portunus trituberculatus]